MASYVSNCHDPAYIPPVTTRGGPRHQNLSEIRALQNRARSHNPRCLSRRGLQFMSVSSTTWISMSFSSTPRLRFSPQSLQSLLHYIFTRDLATYFTYCLAGHFARLFHAGLSFLPHLSFQVHGLPRLMCLSVVLSEFYLTKAPKLQ